MDRYPINKTSSKMIRIPKKTLSNIHDYRLEFFYLHLYPFLKFNYGTSFNCHHILGGKKNQTRENKISKEKAFMSIKSVI